MQIASLHCAQAPYIATNTVHTVLGAAAATTADAYKQLLFGIVFWCPVGAAMFRLDTALRLNKTFALGAISADPTLNHTKTFEIDGQFFLVLLRRLASPT